MRLNLSPARRPHRGHDHRHHPGLRKQRLRDRRSPRFQNAQARWNDANRGTAAAALDYMRALLVDLVPGGAVVAVVGRDGEPCMDSGHIDIGDVHAAPGSPSLLHDDLVLDNKTKADLAGAAGWLDMTTFEVWNPLLLATGSGLFLDLRDGR